MPKVSPISAADPVTLVELHAYNATFYELGLRWHWDADLYDRLREIPAGRERVRSYLQSHQSHLLTAYDADFLADLIEGKRTRVQETLCPDSVRACGNFRWSEARMDEAGH